VFASAPIDVLAARDVKGLYQKALRGELANFTGGSHPYEPPRQPDLEIHSDRETPGGSLGRIVRTLEERGLLEEPPVAAEPLEARAS
jgi:adenylylsulfate kinase